MQSAGPEAVDLTKETEATKKLYGMDDPETAAFGRTACMARRLVERGVRFVELYCGSRQRLGCAHQYRRQSRQVVPCFRQADRRACWPI